MTTPGPLEGRCLGCGDTHPLMPGGAIPDHPSTLGEGLCPGSGHTRVHDDGRDDTRRTAIAHYVKVATQARKVRTELLEKIGDPAKPIGGWIDYYADTITRLETTAWLWRHTAIHGEMWETFRVVIINLKRANGLDDTAARQEGRRVWLEQARYDLAKLAGEMEGRGGEVLLSLLYSG